jgi:hypothetical protein
VTADLGQTVRFPGFRVRAIFELVGGRSLEHAQKPPELGDAVLKKELDSSCPAAVAR